jgi:peptide methionine sulfoxide reductase msrA/msrB
MVRVYVFDRQGKLVGPVESAQVVRSDEEWQRRLTAEQYEISRGKGTERPFCGTLLDNKQSGVYSCVGCGLPLFSAEAKFDSGTGWPSFFQAIGPGNVEEQPDPGGGRMRTEILCARCGGHLGHVFEDGPPPTHQRFCLNSAALTFTPQNELATLADPAAQSNNAQSFAAQSTGTPSAPTATAVLAGGCFWCTEAAFEQLEGVLDVESGYAGGASKTANYQSVCGGDTGHAEAIRITYDPQRISYKRLLDVFFDAHDPTQLNRQGADVGSQYRSAIFYSDDSQRQSAQSKIDQLNSSQRLPRPIVTTLEPLEQFFSAEAYHQDYARRHPGEPYIQHHALPQACKVREKYPQLVKRDS